MKYKSIKDIVQSMSEQKLVEFLEDYSSYVVDFYDEYEEDCTPDGLLTFANYYKEK